MTVTLCLLAVCIGIVAGLRSMTAPAAVSLAAHLGWLNLSGSPLAFMGTLVAVIIFTAGALAEYVADLLPKTPARTTPGPLIARIVTGGLSGACVCVAASQSLALGALLGVIGAVIGTFGGYQVRMRLVRVLNVKDAFVAIPEDIVAILAAYFVVSAR